MINSGLHHEISQPATSFREQIGSDQSRMKDGHTAMLKASLRKVGEILTRLTVTGMRDASVLLVFACAFACSENQGDSAPNPRTATVVSQPALRPTVNKSPARPAIQESVAPESENDFPPETADFDARNFVGESLDDEPTVAHSMDGDDWIERAAELEPTEAKPAELQKLAARHPDPEVRKSSLEKLSEGSERLALESFIAALEDDDLEVVHLAIEQLKSLEDPSAIPSLDLLVQSHVDEEIQQAASDAIEFLE